MCIEKIDRLKTQPAPSFSGPLSLLLLVLACGAASAIVPAFLHARVRLIACVCVCGSKYAFVRVRACVRACVHACV